MLDYVRFITIKKKFECWVLALSDIAGCHHPCVGTVCSSPVPQGVALASLHSSVAGGRAVSAQRGAFPKSHGLHVGSRCPACLSLPNLPGNHPERGPRLLPFIFLATRSGPCTQLVLNQYLWKGGEKEGRERWREKWRGVDVSQSLVYVHTYGLGTKGRGSSGFSELAVDNWGFT